ncbi:hypothetical protein PstZobell_01482 [Stutzerimonas stutzeri ATCC 14405 = CCUG 16156]|uniref:Uncharacterized protein n=1 Tax=Stutzerimonas stutzeri TaxID=316 RepID=B1NC13_STUST|nr:hypothetical protein [Stutzerimonas stutzeri]ABS31634.1 hypothetical protein [Stutzerimonas stutzeri]EHY76091.1 hypothetical protein PstZobell_01482 [Stutzerimonas stutzeri ATCC 14405 = CCUG 16156]MDH0424159.1 hypothetical protein [Stutzerimonas stutzeri]QOZ94613.1 hypothetical protein Pstu14405_04255 [Stutzerimonas stutzeri]
MRRTLFIALLFPLWQVASAANFDIKGINLDESLEVINKKAFRGTYGNAHLYKSRDPAIYCNARAEERGMYAFRGLFFTEFETYRYNTKRDSYGRLTGSETIGGYRVDGISYELYNGTIVRMKIGIDANSSGGDTERVLSKALKDKFGTQVSSFPATWTKGQEKLVYRSPDEIGYAYIELTNTRRAQAADQYIKQICDKHRDDDIREKARDI